jgi:ABC-type antimicrobial peptide transport system permease subunit
MQVGSSPAPVVALDPDSDGGGDSSDDNIQAEEMRVFEADDDGLGLGGDSASIGREIAAREDVGLLSGTLAGRKPRRVKKSKWQRRWEKRKRDLMPSSPSLLWRLTAAQVQSRPCMSLLGCCAVVTVVLTAALLVSVLGKTPLAFLRLAELQRGETDLRLRVGRSHRLNYTEFSAALDAFAQSGRANTGVAGGNTFNSDSFSYHSPRLTYGPVHMRNIRWCFADHEGHLKCPGNAPKSWIRVIDSQREARMGLGRNWPFPAPLGEGEIILDGLLAKRLNVRVGDTVLAGMSMDRMLGPVWFDIVHVAAEHYRTTMIENVPFRLAGISNESYGKNPSQYRVSSYVELEPFMRHMSKYLQPNTPPIVAKTAASLNLVEHVNEVHVNLAPNDRLDAYVQGTFQPIQDRVTAFADVVMYATGFQIFSPHVPILEILRTLSFVNMFLQLIINVILAVLVFISVVLLYALLTTSVESRVFELGVVRMQGATTTDIIFLVITHALFYSAVGIVPALMLSQVIAAYVVVLLGSMTNTVVPPWLTGDGILVATFLGLFMPMFASLMPIRSALSKNVHDALDSRGSRTKAVKIQIDRTEGGGIFSDPSTMVFGIVCSVFGFAIYYLMPLGLITVDLGLLLGIFVSLLVGLLLGLALLSLNIQHFLETVLTTLLLFWERSSVRSTLRKNLVTHRERNQKTLLLFAVSLAFIIFISVSYEIELRTLLYSSQQQNGGVISVTARGTDKKTKDPLYFKNAAAFESVLSSSAIVEDFAWISAEVSRSRSVRSTTTSTIGQTVSAHMNVRWVAPNLLGAASRDPDFFALSPGSPPFRNGFSPFQELYTVAGAPSVIVGSSYQEAMNLQLNESLVQQVSVMNIVQNRVVREDRWRLTAGSFLQGAPALKFSMFPNTAGQDIIVSPSMMIRMAPGVDGMDDMPLERLVLKISSDASDAEKDALISRLGGLVTAGVSVWDFRQDKEQIDQITSILDIFFTCSSVVAMTVCFFSLTAGMYTNIYEQTKEIGILRAVGVTRFFIFRVYTYEALTIVLSGSISGVAIGTVLAVTMSMQRALFTQMPIPFSMPWSLLETVAGLATLFSLLAVVGPVFRLMRMPIVSVMRHHE